jgi:hypothetical protein
MEKQTVGDRYINKEPLITLLKNTFPDCKEADFKVEVRTASGDNTRTH